MIPKPANLPLCFPPLAMSNVAQWIGARQPIEIRESANDDGMERELQ